MTPRVRFRLLACVAFLAFCQLATLAAGMKFALAGFADFRAFYAAGAIVRTGQASNLYDYELQHQIQNQLIGGRTAALPFVYPIYAALPFVPLSLLSYRAAFATLFVINALLLAVAVWILLPHLSPLAKLWRPLPWLIFACFYPVGIALLQGQVSLFLLVILCLCFVTMQHGRDFAAGAILALALMKFHVVLPIVFLFALWRRGKFVAGFTAGAIAVALLCFATAGIAGMRNYLHAMATAASTGSVGSAQDGYEVFSAKMPNLHGLAFALAGHSHFATALLVIASLAVLAVTAAQPPSFPRAIVAALLVSYHLHLHDLTLLLLPLSLILSESVAARQSGLSFKVGRPDLPAFDRKRLGTALFWLASPVLAWMSGAGLNSVLALAMLPLLAAAHTKPANNLRYA